MAWQEIASGGVFDIHHIAQYEKDIVEGQRALLELDLRAPAPDWIVSELKSQLQKAGVKETQVTTGSPLLRVSWRKGFPFLAVVLGIIAGIVFLLVLITGWRFFRDVAEVLPTPVITGGIVLLLAIVAMWAWQRRKQWR